MTDPVARLNAALEGRYAIERELGEGGMATVYLADDLKHERKVALKVLKPELAAVVGAERFLAEIKTTANLTHPHILPLFDSGEADSFLFYVMPHIEGESLRERIDREKQLGVDDSVAITQKVANALDYAHQNGVVHRDIKPGNILLSAQGEPLVADFGIALAVAQAGAGRITETGLSLGTPHYMSPEQATGDRDVDPRSDVYALGCVLYEMLAGQPPFSATTAQAVLVQILTVDAPSITMMRRTVPPNVVAALAKSLEKLPADRFTSAAEFAAALGDESFTYQARPRTTVATPTPEPVAAPPTVAAARPWLRDPRSIVAAVALALAAWALFRPDPPMPVTRVSVDFPEDQGVRGRGTFDISADGSLLVYQGPGASGEGGQLWARRRAALDATPIRDTEGADLPAISPDGQEVAYETGNSIRVVPIQGGIPRTVAPDSARCCVRWSPDGAWLYFNTPAQGLSRVPATGGPVEVVTQIDTVAGETQHLWVDVLPGGRAAVFQAQSGPGEYRVLAVSIESGEVTELTPGRFPRYSQGYLLFTDLDGTTLLAQPFDPGSLELSGAATPIAEGLRNPNAGWNYYAASQTGSLFYSTGLGGTNEADTELVWVTRTGDESPVGWTFTRGGYAYSWRLSPRGTHIALRSWTDGNSDVWVKELPDRPPNRLTSGDINEQSPWWTLPDGETVYFITGGNVWSVPADGTMDPVLFFDGERNFRVGEWSPDGEWLLLRAGPSSSDLDDPELDIVGLRPGVDSVISLVASTGFAENYPTLSPDGRWLAYTSNETGAHEVWVRPFPEVNAGETRISLSGGTRPQWAHSGTELFYLRPNREFVSAQIDTVSGFRVLEQNMLFTVPDGLLLEGLVAPYDVAPDDQRFLMGRSLFESAGSVDNVLVLNWVEELRRRAGN